MLVIYLEAFLANGTIDNTFNQTTNLEVAVKSIVVLPNGKIVFGDHPGQMAKIFTFQGLTMMVQPIVV
jgi:hypothetical protein